MYVRTEHRQNDVLWSLSLHADVVLICKRFVGKITKLVQELRQELYTDPYHEINWNEAHNNCAKVCNHLSWKGSYF